MPKSKSKRAMENNNKKLGSNGKIDIDNERAMDSVIAGKKILQ